MGTRNPATESCEAEAVAKVDLDLIARGVRMILEGIGEDPERAGLHWPVRG